MNNTSRQCFKPYTQPIQCLFSISILKLLHQLPDAAEWIAQSTDGEAALANCATLLVTLVVLSLWALS